MPTTLNSVQGLDYSGQCLRALLRALPADDDGYLEEGLDILKERSPRPLEQYTNPDEIPAFCSCAQLAGFGKPVRLIDVIHYGWDANLIKLYRESLQIWAADPRPKAMFIRLGKVSGRGNINVVVHNLEAYRRLWHPEILYSVSGPHPTVYIEKRTTFVKLLANIGFWAIDREGRTPPIIMGAADDDIRKCMTFEKQVETAKYLVGQWGFQLTRTKRFRDLSDRQLVQEVWDMQRLKLWEAYVNWPRS